MSALFMGFTDELHRQLREALNTAKDNLSEGGAKSFDEYRYHTGVIKGLALAERSLLELVDRAERAHN